jgi:hypothetical protein
MTSYAKHNQTCESSMMPIQKKVARTTFSVFPNKYLQCSLTRNKGQNQHWFLDCIQNITSQSQAIKPDALGLGTKS